MVPSVVLDTNVLVAGLSSRLGAPFRLLEHLLDGRFELLGTPALWLEYEAVLKRDDIASLHGLDGAALENFLDGIAHLTRAVRLHYVWRPQLRDAGDELVLELAVNGQAHVLVTRNVRDFEHAAPRFGLRIATPKAFLASLEN